MTPDGMTPLTAPVKFRLSARGIAGPFRHGDGKWWPPTAAAAEAARRAAASSSTGWANHRTQRRHALEKSARAGKARAREADAAAATDDADDDESVTSKLRRTDLLQHASRSGSPGADSMPGTW